jgi:hypothetical protein
MPPAGFESAISAGERPQTHALDRAAAGNCNQRKIDYFPTQHYVNGLHKDDGLSSQGPTNALDISCSPYKTYNYVKYIKI